MTDLYVERRQGWHRCRPLPADSWAIGREHAGSSPLMTSHNQALYMASEAELRVMFRNAKYPALKWLDAAQGHLVVATSEAGLVAGVEFGFSAGGGGIEQRPIACRIIRASEGGRA